MSELNLTKYESPITPKPGIYENVPYEEYDRWNAFRKSLVPSALRSGAHLEHFIHKGKKSASMNFGSLLDCLLLEPNAFADRFVIQPSTYETEVTRGRGSAKTTETVIKPWNANSHTCQAIAREILESGKQVVTTGDYEKATRCRDAMLSNETIRNSVRHSKTQVSVVWNEPETGVLCKGRFDLIGRCIDDVKTSVDASPDEFPRLAGRFLYHVQAAAYSDAWEILTGKRLPFRLFVVETGDDLFVPAIYGYEHEDTLLAGRLMFKRACQKILDYETFGFRGYSEFEEPLEAPGWMIQREFDLEPGDEDEEGGQVAL